MLLCRKGMLSTENLWMEPSALERDVILEPDGCK